MASSISPIGMNQLTAIFQLMDGHTLNEAAQEVLDFLGAGAAIDADKIENFIAYVNTPPTQEGYFRTLIGAEYVAPLQYVFAHYTPITSRLILIETEGQTEFITGKDSDGNNVLLAYIN